MSAVERQIYRNTIIHEIAHGVWESLADEMKERYEGISWGGTIKKKDLEHHFMTYYSRAANNPAEDFAEHFAVRQAVDILDSPAK